MTHQSALKRQALRAFGALVLSSYAFGIAPAAHAQTPAKTAAPASNTPKVELVTSVGRIVVELDREKAPISVDNFLKYVQSGHYNGTIFHRVIENFMIQGGGFTKTMNEKKTGAPIKIESNNGLHNERGAIAMARTNDPNSATSQFFINVVDNARLDYPGRDGYGYAVFGRVIEGMDVVDKIKVVPTGDVGPNANVPLMPIVIERATVLK